MTTLIGGDSLTLRDSDSTIDGSEELFEKAAWGQKKARYKSSDKQLVKLVHTENM
ncbi:hypothetical protein [Rhodohalobacter mucosus]|uniref:hypothetical protein n=1 Tax=Rhodohalobacter mucosus TaxID=2079485 RepID=UPI001304CC7A|nr:hypothetical protein [Rhodohalobacter mucosus]